MPRNHRTRRSSVLGMRRCPAGRRRADSWRQARPSSCSDNPEAMQQVILAIHAADSSRERRTTGFSIRRLPQWMRPRVRPGRRRADDALDSPRQGRDAACPLRGHRPEKRRDAGRDFRTQIIPAAVEQRLQHGAVTARRKARTKLQAQHLRIRSRERTMRDRRVAGFCGRRILPSRSRAELVASRRLRGRCPMAGADDCRRTASPIRGCQPLDRGGSPRRDRRTGDRRHRSRNLANEFLPGARNAAAAAVTKRSTRQAVSAAVTTEAAVRFQRSSRSFASPDGGGLIQAVSDIPGQAAILVRYLDHVCRTRRVVLPRGAKRSSNVRRG